MPTAWYEWSSCGPLFLCRQNHRKCRAVADPGGDVELAAMAVEDVLDDGEPQTGAALLPARRHADPIEPLGEAGQMLGSDAGSVIRHRGDEAGRAPAAGRLARDRNIDASARLSVLDGVLHPGLEHMDAIVAVAAYVCGLHPPAEIEI